VAIQLLDLLGWISSTAQLELRRNGIGHGSERS
jgi:hypothetical protein